MNLAELRAQLEADRAWREEEIRRFQNQGEALDGTGKQDRYRRLLVLILYAHYEGFCKFAFTLYIDAINAEGISLKDASNAVEALAMADVFRALSNLESKSDIFKRSSPDDAKIHRFARQREFLESLDRYRERNVSIPDDAISVESNLQPVVLRKTLYQLGFPHDQFSMIEGEIKQLCDTRNEISHGKSSSGVDRDTYVRLRKCAFRVMAVVMTQVSQALSLKDYRKKVPIQLPAGTPTISPLVTA